MGKMVQVANNANGEIFWKYRRNYLAVYISHNAQKYEKKLQFREDDALIVFSKAESNGFKNKILFRSDQLEGEQSGPEK